MGNDLSPNHLPNYRVEQALKDSTVPALRIRRVNSAAVRSEGEFVLYWMTSFRRLEWNFALQRAVDWCLELRRPLIVLELLEGNYRWACPRFHQFIIDGVIEKSDQWNSPGALYYPFVEDRPGARRGLLTALCQRASVAVTDDFPCFFIPDLLGVPLAFQCWSKRSTRMA